MGPGAPTAREEGGLGPRPGAPKGARSAVLTSADRIPCLEVDVASAFRRMQERPSLQMVLGLGAATVVLFLAAIVGAIAVGNGDTKVETSASGGVDQAGGTATESGIEGSGEPVVDPVTGETVLPGPTGTIATGSGSGTGSGTATTRAGTAGTAKPQTSAGDRTGITPQAFRWALHAPVTFDGAPLNLAEDPIEGVKVYAGYLNEHGGVNGRKVELQIFDDRYTVEGGKAAANAAVNDYKPFFVSGTLGVDQIYQVSAEAKKRGAPYIAGGGSESVFKSIGMFQVAGSYDTHLIKLAEYLGKESKKPAGQSLYSGLKKIGVSALDSPYISPSLESFKKALEANGLTLVKIVRVQKPTEQTSYGTQIQELKEAGTEIFVPAQDPITTSRQVQECVGQRCTWKYSSSNFAHESDTALTLMGGQWTGVRALAGGCYYTNPNAGDPAKCGQLKAAHEQWVQYNTGRDPDGDGNQGEADWNKDGQGGTAGYQLVHIWLKAMKDIGTDPTREKFKAALLTYDNYADLVSGPITYKGSSNLSHGYTLMVPLEAGSDNKWKQLTPGFVDRF